MPNLPEFFSTYRFDIVGVIFCVVLVAAYALLLVRARRASVRWSGWRTAAFYLGVAATVWIDLGFYSRWQFELRWAFVTKIALLLFAVPMILALGKPVELLQQGLGGAGQKRFEAVMASWPIRLFSNAVFAPLFALFFFGIFLTPISGAMRQSQTAQDVLTVVAVLFGLLMVLPLTSGKHRATEVAMAGEFVFAFAELMFDAIPGLVLSINDNIFDGLVTVAANRPAWFPTALNDQHFAGNLLWIIAEAADLPILILLFARWRRSDREIAREVDDLSDEEFAALTQAHLKGRS